LLVVLAIAATAYVREARTHIDIDPKALNDTMREAVIITIREGSPKQKLDTIAALEQVEASDSVPFVPALVDATKDTDLQVRLAARRTLDRIAPDAIKKDDPE
jgi:hypothetical protein